MNQNHSLTAVDTDMLTYNFTLTNEVGVPLCTIESLEVAAHGRTPLTVQNRYEMVQHTLDINVIFPEESEAGGMRKVVVAGVSSRCYQYLLSAHERAYTSR